MAKSKVQIDIETKKIGTGAEATDRALDDIRKSADEVRAALDRASNNKLGGPEDRKQLAALADQLDRVAVTGTKVAVGQNKAEKATRHGGLAFLELSRAIEDAQYGIRGVLNNIPQMILLMGGTGGLAGVISIAAVGLSTLYTQFTKVEKKTPETTERIDELKQTLKELHQEIAQADFATYLSRYEAVENALAIENESLRQNISLLELKRTKQLELAAVQDDLDLAGIAARQLSDPSFTSSDAAGAREAIARRKIARDRETAEAQAQAKVLAATEQRAITIRNSQVIEINIEEQLARREKLERELNILKLNELDAAALRKRADETGKGLGADRQGALALNSQANSIFSGEDAARLAQLTESLAAQKSLIDSSRESLKQAQQSIVEQSLNLGFIQQEADIVTETARELESQKTTLADLQNSTQAAQAAAGELSGGIATLQALGESAATTRQEDKAAVSAITQSFAQITADGIVTVQELQGANTLLKQFMLVQGQATTAVATETRNLQAVVKTLQAEIARMKAGQIQISRGNTR